MDATLDACLRSWPAHPWLWASLGVAGILYARGFVYWHARDPGRWPAWRLAAFVGALATLFLAIASPIEPFSSLLLQAHMLQHLLLMMLFAPLWWLSAPLFPLLRGLPAPVRIYWAAPLLRSRALRRGLARLAQPLVALAIYTLVTWLWHVPYLYELALRSDRWHYVEHACFLAAALLFWHAVVRPFPSRPVWSAWLLLPALLLADVQNTVLSALFAFSDRPLYEFYASGPRIAGISALDDQRAAGVLMWVPGSIAFLLPLFGIAARLMYGSRPSIALASARRRQPVALPIVGHPAAPVRANQRRFDLFEVPVIGAWLRPRHARLAAQLATLGLALLIMADGFLSSAPAPMNLAGVLPWIHWRAFVVFALVGAGNFACFACPFTLPRRVLNRWLPAGRAWPRALANKWLPIGLVWLFFWAYEAFKLWDSPWLTAWIILGYFTSALAIDSIFRPGTFCKHVCPVGQFNFALSLVSPLSVAVRDANVCASCATMDCIRGNAAAPGCALELYQPRKRDNLDCTFCLDCAQACPHANVGILSVNRAAPWKRRSVRFDVALLIVAMVFAAFANAAGMVAPALAWQDRVAAAWGLDRLGTTTLTFLVLFVALPAALVGAAAMFSGGNWRSAIASYSVALLPIGLAMWAAHYGFHLATSYAGVVPASQRALLDVGVSTFGAPEWRYSCCAAVADWIPRAEILALDLGLLASLYVGYRVSSERAGRRWRRALLPWATLIVLLFCSGVWIVLQPMEMRGLITPGGAARVARATR